MSEHVIAAPLDAALAPGEQLQMPIAPRLLPIVLLCASNIFMTTAWYGHLRFKSAPLWIVVLASWGIALFEYCLAVPANRYGSVVYSAAQLKAMQEVIKIGRAHV